MFECDPAEKSKNVMVELAKKSKNGLEMARSFIMAEKIEYARLREALEYYVSDWNDVTHPGLFAVACEAVGGDLHGVVEVQAGLAMIAAAFDIHDDIIDKSDSKHGKRTVFGKYGDEIALLLGNAFLVEGFALLSRFQETLNRERAGIFDVLKRSLYEFGNAHALELKLKRKLNVPPEEYLEIIRMKAASIEGDMTIGAIVGGGPPEQVEVLGKYGRILGTLAMLREEFVDVFDSQELNQRMLTEYLPLPILFAMRDSKSTSIRIQKLLSGKISRKNIEEIADVVFSTKKVGDLKDYMRGLINDALKLTTIIPNKRVAESLRGYVSSILEDL
jgi:geranylgeranyl pyrophosphate synthase